jgi:hypothetical protein
VHNNAQNILKEKFDDLGTLTTFGVAIQYHLSLGSLFGICPQLEVLPYTSPFVKGYL